MPEEREKFSLDFGIEDTTRTKGETQLIDAVFSGGTVGDPDEVTDKDKDKDKDKTKSTTTSTNTTKPTPPTSTNKSAQSKDTTKKDEVSVDVEEAVLGDDEENEEGGEGNEEDKSKQKTENKENEEEKSTFASLAEDFVGLGMFQLDENEEINPQLSPEEFVQMYQANKNRDINDTINGFLGRFGDDYKDMFQAVFVDGVSPKDYLNTFAKLQDVANLDMTKSENQEKVYAEYLRRQGFTQDRIEAKLQKAKAQGDLEEDATDFHKILVEQDAQDLENQRRTKEEKTLQERRVKQAFAQNANKILVEKVTAKEYDGIPVTDQIAREVFTFLTEEKYKLPSGEPLTEFDKQILELRRPENAALKVKLALLLKNGLDLTKIKVKEKNEQTKQAFQWATKGKQTTNTKTSTNKGVVTTQDQEAFI